MAKPLKTSQMAGKYLTFIVGSEIYGIEILKVQEIIGMMNVTKFPKAPCYVRGVINLRGNVIPVIELRNKFDMDVTEDTEKTCIIVIQLDKLKEGIIVDEVREVIDISESNIETPPQFGIDEEMNFVKGVGKIDEKVIILLDIDRLISGDSEIIKGILED
ncbi:MAG: chemotaxis protein CheW [Candidatus Muirbacterium halophilum]|nr:chemotaxis protein CheW [Candidatus Muirbacterium halophilum]MCK9475091.1 chemotaxis protein CheW [Candidatus Muirbacterium halophilum]